MTYEEAIEYITERYVTMSMCLTLDECRKHNKAISMAIDALDKQIPKKPYDTVRCPLCKIEVELQPIDTEQITYCLHCGQAIDWSEQSD